MLFEYCVIISFKMLMFDSVIVVMSDKYF